MKDKTKGILIVLGSTILITLSQYLFKAGLGSLTFDHLLIVGLGLGIYGISFLLMLIAFRYAPLSSLYPLYATSYIWVALISIFLLGETFTPAKLLGIFIIVGGVSLVGSG